MFGNLVLRKLRLNDRSANDESEVWVIFNKLNELCFSNDNENKIEAIGAKAKADKARRKESLRNELKEYQRQLTDWVNRKLK